MLYFELEIELKIYNFGARICFGYKTIIPTGIDMTCAICTKETVMIKTSVSFFYMTRILNVSFNVSFLDFDLYLK